MLRSKLRAYTIRDTKRVRELFVVHFVTDDNKLVFLKSRQSSLPRIFIRKIYIYDCNTSTKHFSYENFICIFLFRMCFSVFFLFVTVSMFSWPMPFHFIRFKANEIHRLEETQTSHIHCRRRQALSRSIVINMKIYLL